MKRDNLIKSLLLVGIISVSAISTYAFAVNYQENYGDLIVSTDDMFNDKEGIEQVNVRKAATSASLDCSRIYSQVGNDGTNYYLRFATAVRGDIDNITYTGSVVDTEVVLPSKEVNSVYKSIYANGERFYHNGKVLLETDLTSTNEYYWACYTIKFSANSQYKSSYVNINIDVNGEYQASKTVSLAEELDNSSLGKYVTSCKNDGINPSFSVENKILSGYKHNGFEIPQGVCTDGEYLYISMNTNGNEGNTKNSSGYVIKFDIDSKKVVAATEQISVVSNNDEGLGNANLFYNEKDGMIYSFGNTRTNGGQCDDFRIDPSDMSYERLGNILEVEGFKFELPNVDTYYSSYAGTTITYDVYNIEYNPLLGRFAVTYQVKSDGSGISGPYRMFYYDDEQKLVENVTQNVSVRTASNTDYTIQESYSDKQYMYIDYTKYGKSTMISYIRIYDWNGNLVNEVQINGGASGFASATSSNIQAVIALKGELYVASYQSGSGLHLTKVSLGSVSSAIQDTVGNMSFGEIMEHSSLSGVEPTLKSTEQFIIKDSTTTIKNIPGYGGVDSDGNIINGKTHSSFFFARGNTTDGKYVYVALNAKTGSTKNSGFDMGVVAKYDLSGNLIDYTKNAFQWGNGVRLSIIDGILYVARTNGNVSSSSYSNTLVYHGHTLSFNLDLDFLGTVSGVAGIELPSGATYDNGFQNEDGEVAIIYKKAVDGATKTYLETYKKENGEYVKISETLDITKSRDGKTSIMGVYANNSYVYVLFNAQTNLTFEVYDVNLNFIKYDNMDSFAEGTDTYKHFQGLLVIDNVLYYGICKWSTGYTGFGLYKVNVSYDYKALEASKNPGACTVSFDVGECPTKIEDSLVKRYSTVSKPETPVYKHTSSDGKEYTFVIENWYYGESVWNFETNKVTRDITLKANWTLDDSYFEVKENADVRTSTTTARLMSFNVLCDDYNNKPAVNDTRANQGFDTIEAYQPDVVGLQEFDDQWYNKAATLLDGYAIVNNDNRKVDGNTNYSTLAYNTSTVKVVEYSQQTLPTSDNPNCRKVTIAVFEFIAGDNIGKQFIVGSTHWDLTEERRVIQASENADILKTWEEKYPDTPVFMTGDFNSYDFYDSYNKFIEDSGYHDAKHSALTKGIVCRTGHLGNPMKVGSRDYSNPFHVLRGKISFSYQYILEERCIDHIFASQNVTTLYYDTIIDDRALSCSDHMPIYADFRF